MIATGNAHISNDRFDATANRVSYNQSTDMMVVEGTPRSDANLWFKQTANDKNPTHLVAEEIQYRVKDQWHQVLGVKNLKINRK
jgi:lipopolysaccharide assembly outer membrane protein LptD (OstA)